MYVHLVNGEASLLRLRSVPYGWGVDRNHPAVGRNPATVMSVARPPCRRRAEPWQIEPLSRSWRNSWCSPIDDRQACGRPFRPGMERRDVFE